ncbi:hypothetical protein BpHYR1_043168 [Brachionus plicatilis]|uniref:Uncharacterized protein n=1 Tax=Brachionus plicatilis TaxID=10195 RepID=A0A3M7QH85_BRAPC|nr:hypothetical protein BpHYR1_043168 [Brachionus plicatilis]
MTNSMQLPLCQVGAVAQKANKDAIHFNSSILNPITLWLSIVNQLPIPNQLITRGAWNDVSRGRGSTTLPPNRTSANYKNLLFQAFSIIPKNNTK